MRAVVFLVYLCFFLLGKNDYVAAAMQRAGYTQTHALAKSLRSGSVSTEYALITGEIDADGEKEYLVSDEVEDEDTDSTFLKKSKLSGFCYFAFAHLFCSDHSLRRFTTLASLQGESSPNYITQRVLRI